MPMKMTGNVVVEAPREEVWKLFFDVDVLKLILNKIPGISVERLVQVGEDKYEATATIGVAMVKGKYDGTLTVLDKRVPEYLKFHGEGSGGGNWTNGDMALTFTPQDGKTLLAYEGTGNVNGPLAAVGQRLIDMAGKQFVANGTKALAQELAQRTNASTAAPSTSKPSARPTSAPPPPPA